MYVCMYVYILLYYKHMAVQNNANQENRNIWMKIDAQPNPDISRMKSNKKQQASEQNKECLLVQVMFFIYTTDL